MASAFCGVMGHSVLKPPERYYAPDSHLFWYNNLLADSSLKTSSRGLMLQLT